jgi:hypothetical protein
VEGGAELRCSSSADLMRDPRSMTSLHACSELYLLAHCTHSALLRLNIQNQDDLRCLISKIWCAM